MGNSMCFLVRRHFWKYCN